MYCLLFLNPMVYADPQKTIDRISKANLSGDLLAEAQNSKFSLLELSENALNTLYKTYPDGAIVFAKNQDLATKFNSMVKAFQNNPKAITLIRKIQVSALNDLYNYLMKIYTNFNLTHPGAILTSTTPSADIAAYLADEAAYHTTKKSLIINHFIDLIQRQFQGTVLSYNPQLVPDTAVSFGKIFIQNDYSLNLQDYINNPTSEQQQALTTLRQYFDFYQSFTDYLAKLDPATGVNAYYTIAQAIQKLQAPADQQSSKPLTLQPEMFFYDQESLRAILFIPYTANSIPTSSKLVPWAPSIIDAAQKKLLMNGHQIAYFKDAQGNTTQDQTKAASLYVVTETGPNLFEQELLAQPGWMNSLAGVARVMKGCLGDCSALVGMGILQENVEKIIQKITQK
jgi:hypothetical protein